MAATPPVVLLMGPTACGKTDLAVELVRDYPCDIVSVDSALVYRGMDIGTAKPDAATLAVAPHRLIDILDPAQPYSAARFREDALGEIAEIRGRGRIPLLVGGTMLYFRALTEGLAELPAADPAVRDVLNREAQTHGWAALHRRLAQSDPETAARLHPNDAQRIQRALEVETLAGRPLSRLLRESASPPLAGPVVRIALTPTDRRWLHGRIEARFRSMLAEGFIDEVASLRARGDLTPEHPSMRAVGYRQVWSYLEGHYDHDTLLERGVAATRQFAKRQLTWMRREPDGNRVDPAHVAVRHRVRERLESVLQ
jgi:tRNA dimethylallyltransferase